MTIAELGIRGFILACVILSLGVPITTPLRAAIAFIAVFVSVFCERRRMRRANVSSPRSMLKEALYPSLLSPFAIAVATLLLSHLLPRLQIQEGHNVFLTEDKPDEILARGLPKPVFDLLREQFFEAYPKTEWCDDEKWGCWRYSIKREEASKARVFADSADALLSVPAKYSRVVDGIGFSSIETHRPGFTNTALVNWTPDKIPNRARIPYFVMYELPPDAVGGSICFRGTVLWERSDSSFETIRAVPDEICRIVAEPDAGMRVFGLSVKSRLEMRLEPSAKFVLFDVLRGALACAGALLILFIAFQPNLSRLKAPAFIAILSILAMLPTEIQNYFSYPIYPGSNDGLNYDRMGRLLARLFVEGNFSEFLRGQEMVFKLMPGMRYFRAFEKLIFGDTNIGQFFVMALLPLALYQVLRLLMTKRSAIEAACFFIFARTDISTELFCDRASYASLAMRGLGEPLGTLLFCLGAYFLLRDEDHKPPAADFFAGNLMMALSVFVRPNYIAGYALLWLWLFIKSYKRYGWRDYLLLLVACAPTLFIPLHDLIFGGQVVSGTNIASNPYNLHTPPSFYIDLARAWIGSRVFENSAHAGVVIALMPKIKAQLVEWLPHWYNVVILMVAVLPLFLPKRLTQWRLAALAACCVGLHLPMLFYDSYSRYATLAWLLSAIVAGATMYRLAEGVIASRKRLE
jgi:hypothetical protein